MLFRTFSKHPKQSIGKAIDRYSQEKIAVYDAIVLQRAMLMLVQDDRPLSSWEIKQWSSVDSLYFSLVKTCHLDKKLFDLSTDAQSKYQEIKNTIEWAKENARMLGQMEGMGLK
jgi:hypothetical protein